MDRSFIFDKTLLCFSCRSSPAWDRDDLEREVQALANQVDTIATADATARCRSLAIDSHMPADYGSRRAAAGLEKPAIIQPSINADWLNRVGHTDGTIANFRCVGSIPPFSNKVIAMRAEPIKATLKFLANLDEPLVYIPSKGGGDETDHVGNFTIQTVSIHDGRKDKQCSRLDVEGFKLVSQKTEVADFYDDVQVQSTYHEEVKALLTDILGAARIEIFDDTRRSSSLEQQRNKKIREPAEIVHNDYTARSGVKRLLDHFADDPDEAGKLLQRRFAIVNVWRSIAGPVYNHPLVLCDASTVRPEDLVSVERRAEERIGELQVALYDPGQRWYYFPEMQMDEALLFKTFDSANDGRARFTVHSSFEEPNAPVGTPPRESIETRCLVFF